jgi:xylulose-5-phosphate/fructose-6-phosphate phosphoketolase
MAQCCRFLSQWLQDRRTDGARTQPEVGAGEADAQVWIRTLLPGDDPEDHQLMAEPDHAERHRGIQKKRAPTASRRPAWPMIVLNTPKGWTGPKRGRWQKDRRDVQVASGPAFRHDEAGTRALSRVDARHRAEELFDKQGRFLPELAELAPTGTRRMGANPHANGGLLLKDLNLPDFREYAVEVTSPGATDGESTRVMGKFLRDVITANADARNFRIVGPDETTSNRLDAAFEVTTRESVAEIIPDDDHVSPDGRVMEMLSEHACQGWLEGYPLTGRHGFFLATKPSSTSSTRCSISTRSG